MRTIAEYSTHTRALTAHPRRGIGGNPALEKGGEPSPRGRRGVKGIGASGKREETRCQR